MDHLKGAMRRFKVAGNHDHPEEPEHAAHAEHHGMDQNINQGQFEVGERTPVYPHPGDSPPGPGHMPPKVANLDYRGPMKFFKPNGQRHDVARDLGFSGVIDGKIVWCWGDTLMCIGKPGKDYAMCCNDSTSIGSMKRPMTAMDTSMNGGNVAQWVPPTQQEVKDGGIVRYGYGGTNIVEIAPNKGLVYYLKNDRKGGGGVIVGAGVATVHMEGNIPKATRHHETLWNTNEPFYGDVGIQYNKQDGHVYAIGHGPAKDKELSSRTFLCKVPAEHALNIEAYEYWHNGERRWSKTRMTEDGAHGTNKLKQEDALFGWFNMNQANPFWSNYFNKWMIIHGDCFGFSSVHVQTADRIEGPWHDHGEIAKTDPAPDDPNAKAFRYCQTGHPWVDPSGKKVLATWTRANIIWGVMIEWA